LEAQPKNSSLVALSAILAIKKKSVTDAGQIGTSILRDDDTLFQFLAIGAHLRRGRTMGCCGSSTHDRPGTGANEYLRTETSVSAAEELQLAATRPRFVVVSDYEYSYTQTDGEQHE
jgi:hypothetical protein